MVEASQKSERLEYVEVGIKKKPHDGQTSLNQSKSINLIDYLKSPVENASGRIRKFVMLFIDLSLILFSPFAASFIRENFVADWQKLSGLVPYSMIGLVVAAVCFLVVGTHRSIWRHVSLHDFTRIIVIAIVIVLITAAAGFVIYRLEGVPRSLPLIQLTIIISTMSAIRLAVRWRHGRRKPQTHTETVMQTDHVLLIGMNRVAELYIRCVADLASDTISIVGILDESDELKGRLLHHHKVLGQPVELPQFLAQFNVHGVEIKRVIVATKFEKLSEESRETLLRWERSGHVTLDLFEERLGFGRQQRAEKNGDEDAAKKIRISSPEAIQDKEFLIGNYAYVKRAMDIIGAIVLLVILSPLILLVSILTAIDVGFPLIFWQQRPGYLGQPFKLYKFRTMKTGHDEFGNRIDDDQRTSTIGYFFRRLRFDELPQLYNILVGEMSFIGPRPLLPVDQPEGFNARLAMPPGLSGWAQVNGGKLVTAEDKTVLDLWYVKNATFRLDVRIVVRTLAMLITGERLDVNSIRIAYEEMASATRSDPAPILQASEDNDRDEIYPSRQNVM